MTLENIVIHAQVRESAKKSTVRKHRQSGLVPGVLYRKGTAVQIAISSSNLPKEHTRSRVVKLVLNGEEKSVLMREVQVHPITDKPIHFDFQEVQENDVIRTHVPLNFVGLTREQEKEGSFNIRTRYLEIKTKLSKLPRSIEVDVSGLKADQSVQLHDLKFAEGVVVRTGKGKNVALASLVKI